MDAPTSLRHNPSYLPHTNRLRPPTVGSRLHVYVAGLGSVGTALLRQLALLRDVPITVVGACTSERAAWQPRGLAIDALLDGPLPEARAPWPTLARYLAYRAPRPLVFVDVTGHPDPARRYPDLLEAGIHVVTASKLANTFEQSFFDRMQDALRDGTTQYRYETNAGAGLPVVQTLLTLRHTGDRVRKVHGCASGTLTYLFDALGRGVPFSKAVRSAVAKGYTEPDLRDDLSGEDVARKFLILARTAGRSVERADVEVESLVPAPVRDLPREEVPDALAAYDDDWAARVEAARAEGAVLRYTGILEDDTIQVGVEAVPVASPLGRLIGTDNLFAFHTDRYADTPLVVQGPGAGPEVTAAGVLGDILHVAQALGTRRSD